MKSASVFTSVNYTKNWKALALIVGLILANTLTSCSTTRTATPDAMQQGDAMKGDVMKDNGGAMKGDAMKDKDGATKGDAKSTPTTKQ